jgi:hypothetical protein
MQNIQNKSIKKHPIWSAIWNGADQYLHQFEKWNRNCFYLFTLINKRFYAKKVKVTLDEKFRIVSKFNYYS